MTKVVDGHVYPTFGEDTSAQDAIGWLRNSLHGGTTTMVSAGELHVPGGVLEVGEPADLLLLGPIRGFRASDSLKAFPVGDVPGLSAVILDGEPVISPRTEQLPPPRVLAEVSVL